MTAEPALNVLPFTTSRPLTSLVHVDPDTAAEWLKHNTNNRPIRPTVLASYVRDMKAGRWQLTGEAVKFATDGTLLDGQHRLEAVIRAGVTAQMFVISGLAPHTREVMDTGAKRTTADALRMSGEPDSVALAAGGRLAVRFEQGSADERTRSAISNAEIIAWIDANPSIRTAVETVREYFKEIPVSKGVLVYMMWRLQGIDDVSARDFVYQVAHVDAIPNGDARSVLHKRLNAMSRNKTVDTPAGYLDLFFQAWNRWREGKTATLFRVHRDHRGRVSLTEPR